jgi:hypothetical protein
MPSPISAFLCGLTTPPSKSKPPRPRPRYHRWICHCCDETNYLYSTHMRGDMSCFKCGHRHCASCAWVSSGKFSIPIPVAGEERSGTNDYATTASVKSAKGRRKQPITAAASAKQNIESIGLRRCVTSSRRLRRMHPAIQGKRLQSKRRAARVRRM